MDKGLERKVILPVVMSECRQRMGFPSYLDLLQNRLIVCVGGFRLGYDYFCTLQRTVVLDCLCRICTSGLNKVMIVVEG